MTTVTDISEFAEELQDGFYTKKILIEGDSWVSHPLVKNIEDQINNYKPDDYLILNLAEPGDEASSVFKPHGRQMKKLKKLLNTEQWGDTFDLILLSAAGNDIVGPEIITKGYVKNKRDFPNLYGRELLTDSYYNTVGSVSNGYDRFLHMRDNSVLNESTPVITHVYSYLTPREVGTHIGDIMFNKGWIKRHLKHQGIKDKDEQSDIVIEMLDSLYRHLVMVEKKYNNFLVVDTRNVLSKNGVPDVERWWYDEIHPNSEGFKKVTNHIRKKAIDSGLWNL